MLRSQKGLTFIELMIAVAIMGVTLLAASYALISAHHLSEESRSRLLAANAARTTLEAVKDTPLQSIPAMATAGFVPQDLPNGAIQILTNPAVGAGTQVATVTVRVTWTGSKNDTTRSMDITTRRSRFD